MNDPKVIHETVISDIINIWDSLKDIKDGDLKELLGRYQRNGLNNTSSMAKTNSNLVLTFPVLCSKGISIETASMISKAVERYCTSMMQHLFSAFQLQDVKDVNSAMDFVRQFHTNIDSKYVGYDDIFDIATKLESSDISRVSLIESAAAPHIKNDMRNIDYVMPSDINESSLSSFVVSITESKPNFDGSGTKKIGGEDIKKSASEYFKNQVLNSDYKKANELQPTTIVVSFKIKTDKSVITYDNVVVGIKCKLYPIASEDVMSHIASTSNDRNWLIKFIKATTREISFIKDFALAIDKAKLDALSLSKIKKSSDKMWKVLERRAKISRLKRSLHQPNNASAITTLCVSQDEVEYMRKNYNVDLESVSTIVGLFESLNLMGVCIVDENLEVAKFIFDEEDPMWETISFTHLERESSDNTYKRVVNLMTKISR